MNHPHFSLYLKNLLGPQLGLKTDVSFDQHTGVLSDALLDKSPEEVLGIFLKHFTPEVLVAAVTRSLQGCSEDKKIALRSILFDPLYWTNGEVNEKGAFELLNTLGFINSK